MGVWRLKYTCRVCGWIKENQPYHSPTDADFKEILDHEKEHRDERKWWRMGYFNG